MSDSDNAKIEQMIKDAGATGPRITEESIKAKIVDALYSRFPESGTTVCVIWLRNGFSFVGHSGCADPANYRKEIGDTIAYKDAFRQIWAAEGYLLKEVLHQAAIIRAKSLSDAAGTPTAS